jgi:hypothetical protein
VLPISKSGIGVGGGFRNDSGVLVVWGTLSEISRPAFTKKELNSFAISEGELRIMPLALMGGMSLVLSLLLLPVISLRMSQIF